MRDSSRRGRVSPPPWRHECRGYAFPGRLRLPGAVSCIAMKGPTFFGETSSSRLGWGKTQSKWFISIIEFTE